jgi:hypothetical protein
MVACVESGVMQDYSMKEFEQKPVACEEIQCGNCGRYGAYQIGNAFLCEHCYAECGSCCPEFGTRAEVRDEKQRSKSRSSRESR